MGLFSSSKKNKQDKLAQNLGQDPGHFSRAEDEAIGEKARAKRASSAGGAAGRGRKDAPDQLLPEKKRARRRLVGAVALALAAAIGIPMLLDSEPKPLSGDIAIQIPSKEHAPALPQPAAPAPVATADTLDKQEEIVTAPTSAPAKAEPPRKVSKYDTELRDEPEPTPAPAPKPKPAPAKSEPKPEPKVAKVEKPVEKPVKVEKPKPVKPDAHPLAVKSDDNARALAILEDKEDKPGKAEKAPVDTSSQRFVLQVAALASQEKVTELQAKLAGAGLRSYTQKGETAAGAHVIRVRVGPFSKDEAEKIRAKLGAMGLSGSMVPV
ncbi:MAG: SPOR domain-containing protein [Pseudomonadota bacterium]|nr:SPOR domain-containing protein [Pseudomonadota bacterium]